MSMTLILLAGGNSAILTGASLSDIRIIRPGSRFRLASSGATFRRSNGWAPESQIGLGAIFASGRRKGWM